MPSDGETIEFIRSSFRSVWTLELMLLLRTDPDRTWTARELVEAMRGSDLVVSRAVDELLAAGLVVSTAEGNARYHPVTPELDVMVEATAALYARMPDMVRRTIVVGSGGGLAAFANAFKLRGD